MVRFFDILLLGPICACRVRVWLVLSFAGMCVLKSLSSLVAVPWHGQMDLLVWVVPCDGETEVAFPLPVVRCGIVHVECLKEVFGMFYANVLHSKVIRTEYK